MRLDVTVQIDLTSLSSRLSASRPVPVPVWARECSVYFDGEFGATGAAKVQRRAAGEVPPEGPGGWFDVTSPASWALGPNDGVDVRTTAWLRAATSIADAGADPLMNVTFVFTDLD